jgi:hypothetical protein
MQRSKTPSLDQQDGVRVEEVVEGGEGGRDSTVRVGGVEGVGEGSSHRQTRSDLRRTRQRQRQA